MKNLFKNALTLTLAAATILTATPSVAFAADGYDTTAPVISNITVPTTEYSTGDTIDISMNITEEDTGISNAYITYSCEEKTESVKIPVTLTAVSGNFTGAYTASYTIPSTMTQGHWVMTYAYAKDVAGNIFRDCLLNINRINITTVESDITAPTLVSLSKLLDSVSVSDTQYAVITCNDDDLAKISFTVGNTETAGERTINYSVSSIAADGIYNVPITFTDADNAGTWSISGVTLTDTTGNYQYNNVYTNFTLTSDVVNDTEKPSITSATWTTDSVTMPGYANVVVKGHDNTVSSNVSVNIGISNSEVANTNAYYSGTATTDSEGNFECTIEVPFMNGTASGTWNIDWVKVTDASSNWIDSTKTFDSITATNSEATVDKQVVLGNTNVVSTIEAAADNAKIYVTCSNSNSVAPSEYFSAIDNTNKTLIFDLDGIQWIFNGSNISAENIKDVQLGVTLENIDTEQYGYEVGSTGIRINFAPNGMLPGTCTVRIKSDYITRKYNLSSQLYLAFIKDTMDVEEERVIGHEYVWPKDEDGNDVYCTREYLYDENGENLFYSVTWKETGNTFEFEGETYPEYEAEVAEGSVTIEELDALFEACAEDETIYVDEDGYLLKVKWNTPEVKDITETITYQVDTYVQIEDTNATIDSEGFVNLTLTHNSSYVLTDKASNSNTCKAVVIPQQKPATTTTTNNNVSNTSSNNNSTSNSNNSVVSTGSSSSSSSSSVSGGSSSSSTSSNATVATTTSNNDTTATTETNDDTTVTTDTNNTTIETSTTTTATVKTVKTVKGVGKVVVSKTAATFKFSSNYKGYSIKYSTSKNFKNAKSVSTSKSSKKISNLKSGKKYYVKVRGYKMVNGKKVWSSWKTTTITTSK